MSDEHSADAPRAVWALAKRPPLQTTWSSSHSSRAQTFHRDGGGTPKRFLQVSSDGVFIALPNLFVLGKRAEVSKATGVTSHTRGVRRGPMITLLTLILPTSGHSWHHIPVMWACCCPELRGAPCQWGGSRGWGTYHSELSAFWRPRVICLTAIKHWKEGRGSFMKAIIACKDWECLCWGPLAAEISIQICKHHPDATFQ